MFWVFSDRSQLSLTDWTELAERMLLHCLLSAAQVTFVCLPLFQICLVGNHLSSTQCCCPSWQVPFRIITSFYAPLLSYLQPSLVSCPVGPSAFICISLSLIRSIFLSIVTPLIFFLRLLNLSFPPSSLMPFYHPFILPSVVSLGLRSTPPSVSLLCGGGGRVGGG